MKSTKEKIVSKVAEELQFPEEVVESVIAWSYKKANQAATTNKEIEISGLGTFKLSQAKVKRRLEKLQGAYDNSTDQVIKEGIMQKINLIKKVNEQ